MKILKKKTDETVLASALSKDFLEAISEADRLAEHTGNNMTVVVSSVDGRLNVYGDYQILLFKETIRDVLYSTDRDCIRPSVAA